MDLKKLAGLLTSLESFRNLPDNWDSYGARAIYPRAIDVARKILPALGGLEHVWVVPTSDGGVAITAEGERIVIEVSVYGPDFPGGHQKIA